MENRNGNEKSALTVKAEDQKIVATALLSPPAGEGASGILREAVGRVTAAYAAHLEEKVFPIELKRYADTQDKGKRRSYEPLHIYLSWELTAAAPLSSCLGELFFYRGERLADYRAFSLTADENAGIFLREKVFRSIFPFPSFLRPRKAAPAVPDGFYIRNDGSVIGYRRVAEGFPCRIRRRDVREKFLKQWVLGSTRSYRSIAVSPPKCGKQKKSKKNT